MYEYMQVEYLITPRTTTCIQAGEPQAMSDILTAKPRGILLEQTWSASGWTGILWHANCPSVPPNKAQYCISQMLIPVSFVIEIKYLTVQINGSES